VLKKNSVHMGETRRTWVGGWWAIKGPWKGESTNKRENERVISYTKGRGRAAEKEVTCGLKSKLLK